MKKQVALLTVFALLAAPFSGFFGVSAAALTNMDVTGAGIVATSSAVNVDVTPTITFDFTTAIAPTDVVQITFTGGPLTANNGIIVDNAGGLASADITVANGCSGAVTLAGSPIADNTANPTLSLTGITGVPGTCEIIIAASRLDTNVEAGNTSVGITTQSGDFGAFLWYIGDANDVNITALVPPTLSFVLKNAADTALLAPGLTAGNRVCDMGVLQLAATPNPGTGVNGCQYRLKVATNAGSGYTINFVSSSVDTAGGAQDRLAKTATVSIPDVAGAGDDLTATSGYGVRLSPAAGHTRGGDFGATPTDYYVITDNTADDIVSNAGPVSPAGTDLVNTTLVEHGVRIDAAQEVGAYSHVVTYTVTASF